jgi:Ca2+-binding EF-hand superfamily protein
MTSLRIALIATALPALLAAAPPDYRPINVVGHAWAPFISPMGEPFRARTRDDDTLARWFNQADGNHDGQVTPDELKADADRFFATLDADGDGEIGPEELIRYEWELAPDIQVNSRLKSQPREGAALPRPEFAEDSPQKHREKSRRDDAEPQLGGLQGAARYGLLNMPEPVAAADADFNRSISRAEFEQAAIERFKLLDVDGRGALTLTSLEAMWTSVLARVKDRKRRPDPLDTRVGLPVPLDR